MDRSRSLNRPSHAGRDIPVLVSALGSRLLRLAGELADGTVLWMTTARAIETHVVPNISAAAEGAGRPAPRIVAGLPVAVHDDETEARVAAAARSTVYAGMASYQRILTVGGVASFADAAIVGNESVGPHRAAVAARRRCDRHLGRSLPRGRQGTIGSANDRPTERTGDTRQCGRRLSI